uniref:C2H2-type domain-containing protein n=1 Tax=Anopheles atroparvus TaxID=41427 RepID=A0AAG5DID7_ANOAO
MAKQIEELGRFCRFCLRREGLMALSEATSSAFSIEDALHYTGIMLSEDEDVTLYAVCLECCLTIKNSVGFRLSCMNNDITFKRLVSLLKARIKDKAGKKDVRTEGFSIVIDSESEDETRFLQTMENDPAIVAIDDSDSDSGSDYSMPSLYGEAMRDAVSDESKSSFGHLGKEPPASIAGEERQKGNATCSTQSILKTFDDCENSEFTPSLDEKVNCPLDGSKETEKEAVDGVVESNLMFSYSSDSNDSLPSIYEESIRAAMEAIDTVNPIDERRHVCPICGGLFVDIHHHLERAHGTEKKFACPHCQKRFQSRFYLKRHMNTWHEKRIILTCEHCGKGFTNHSSHFYHLKNSHGESDVYECEICHRKFKSIDGYRKHKKEHSITAYPCPHCDKLFKTTVTLEKHKLRYHPT